ncbi:sensor histidine kinase [Bacillus sp. Marseille-Q3570]|uniref:sensor histidine kinase n=1 Tax=Bacillus sp. Marseille-Q3570 TaxID=2963522 RepID=UPI0021B823E3|nr:sensor histidine kinase [Bacillus sp. Marseille-Q3570]
MSFLDYLKDKRYFFCFYFLIIAFVTLMMFLSQEKGEWTNIIYTNVSCLLFLVLYIVIGYLYRRKFYNALKQNCETDQMELLVMPDPQNNAQKISLELLDQLHKDYNRQLQRLYDEKRDQQEFILSWIHEIKLPIAASRLLIENSDDLAKDVLVDWFEDELDKIDDDVEQALYYSRIDSFSKDYFITEIEVNSVVKKSIKKYAKPFINKHIEFQMDEQILSVHSDSKWLGFVIDQIIVNALKYTNEGGMIAVSFEEDQQERRLLIEDDGMGIKPEDLQRVFEKGFTGSIGRNHTKSTGMGLYLAEQLANKLGHSLSIDSVEGQYTKLIIHFPKIRNYYHFP